MSPGPIARLPLHVLQLIFSYFIPVYPIRLPGPDARAILNLAQTCSCWRQVALETPELWANIELDLAPNYRPPIMESFRSPLKWFTRATRKPVKYNVRVAVEWLKRAKDRHRSLRLHSRYIIPNSRMKTWVIAILHDIIARFPFRQLDLRLPSSHISQLFQSSNGALAHLRVLEVWGQYKSRGPEGPSPVFHPETRLPNLQTICLQGFCTSEYLNTALSWNNVRRITLSHSYGVQPSACLDILRQCSVIEHFEVFVSDDRNASTTQINALVTLPTLVTLELRSIFLSESNCMEPFLRTLTMPNLERCTIQYSICPPRFPLIFSEMVCRSSYMPRLRQLTLSNVGEGVDEVIRYVPSLVSLNIDGFGLGPLNDGVIYDMGMGKLLPKLRRLEIAVESVQEAEKVLRFATLRVQRCTGDDINIIKYDEDVAGVTDDDDDDDESNEDDMMEYNDTCYMGEYHEDSDDYIEDENKVSLCKAIRVSFRVTSVQEIVQLRKLSNILRKAGVDVYVDV